MVRGDRNWQPVSVNNKHYIVVSDWIPISLSYLYFKQNGMTPYQGNIRFVLTVFKEIAVHCFSRLADIHGAYHFARCTWMFCWWSWRQRSGWLFLFSHRLSRSDCYDDTFYTRTFSTSKNCMGSDLTKGEAKISWLFFGQYIYSIHDA